jgi:D-glycero-alpha-D-manno-heptose-7-phosphate kinase
LSRRIVVAYTHASRQSGINNWEVMQRRINGDRDVTAAFDAIRDAAAGLRAAVVQKDWSVAGLHLAAEWAARKRLAPGVTTAEIDVLLDRARTAGALAGKVCGAGGGGCLFCLVHPSTRDAVADALASGGARVLDCAVDAAGLILRKTAQPALIESAR